MRQSLEVPLCHWADDDFRIGLFQDLVIRHLRPEIMVHLNSWNSLAFPFQLLLVIVVAHPLLSWFGYLLYVLAVQPVASSVTGQSVGMKIVDIVSFVGYVALVSALKKLSRD